MSLNKKELLLQLKDIKITFGSGRKKVKAVNDVSFDIYKGETFGLVGESGSGKTTIGRAIVGIQPLSSGRIYLGDKLIRGKTPNVKRFTKSIGLKLQKFSQDVNITSNFLQTYIKFFKITYYKYLFHQEYNSAQQNKITWSKYKLFMNVVGEQQNINATSSAGRVTVQAGELPSEVTFKNGKLIYNNPVSENKKVIINAIGADGEKSQIWIDILPPLAKNTNYSLDKEIFNKSDLTKTPVEYSMIFSRTVNDIGVLNDVINSIKKSLRLLEDLNIYIQISKNKLNGVISNFNVLLDKCNYVKEQLSIAYTSFLNIADCRTKAKNEQYSNVEDFLKEIGESIRIATKCYKDVIETAKALSKFNLDSKDVLEIDNLIKTSDFFIKPSRRDKYKLKQKIQMIFQDPASSLNERMSVEQIISEGLQNFPDSYLNSEVKKAYIEHYNKNLPIQKQINETQVHPYELKKFVVVQQLQGVGLLQQHLGRYPHEFSGGQRQRIAIARSLVIKPSFIVADEPISALDVSIRSQVLNLLKEFQKIYDLTYLFIAHDLTVVKVIADRVAVIYRGQIVELATSKELFKNPLHPYTKALLSAVPIPNPKLEKEKKIIEYQPEKSHYDYLINSPEWQKISNDHYVLANSRELKEYKTILKREK